MITHTQIYLLTIIVNDMLLLFRDVTTTVKCDIYI